MTVLLPNRLVYSVVMAVVLPSRLVYTVNMVLLLPTLLSKLEVVSHSAKPCAISSSQYLEKCVGNSEKYCVAQLHRSLHVNIIFVCV